MSFDIVIIIRVAAFGGTERHTISMIRYLADAGIRILVIESGEKLVSDAIGKSGTPVSFVHTDLPLNTTVSRELVRWQQVLRQANVPRVLLVKAWYYAASPGFMKLLHKEFDDVLQIEHTTIAPRRKWGIDIHLGHGVHPGIWWYKEQIRLWRLSRVSGRVITVSNFNKQCLTENAFIDGQRIVVCENGIDTALWRRDGEIGRRFRSELQIPETAFVFCCAGRLAPEKGYELAVDAFNVLLETCASKDVYLCIVGEGTERRALEERASGGGSKIKFAGFRSDMVAVYSAADVLLVPTHHEGFWSGESFGLSLAEAMSCECNVIVSAHGALPEVLGDRFSEALISNRSANSWASAMAELVSIPEGVRKEIGVALRQRVVERFDEGRRMRALVEAIVG